MNSSVHSKRRKLSHCALLSPKDKLSMLYKIVIDTSVLISGLYSNKGAAFKNGSS